MTVTSQTEESRETASLPARSGTVTAWITLGLIALMITLATCWASVFCTGFRTAVSLWAWKRGESLTISGMSRQPDGEFLLTGMSWKAGPSDHRSSLSCESARLRLPSLRSLLLPRPGQDATWIAGVSLGRTKILLDTRGVSKRAQQKEGKGEKENRVFPWEKLLPGALNAGPVDAIVIGDSGRIELRGLTLDFPRRWQGSLSFAGASADLGSVHREIPATTAPAWWGGGSLRIAELSLGEGLALEEASVSVSSRGAGFGLRGRVGKGLLRGDGTIGGENPVDATVVGEKLALEALATMMPGLAGASGTVDQARMTFRGDPVHPFDADASLRIAGRNLRWEGRGWERLRLAATMTGRNLTLSECILRQGENEVTATGRSRLPSDWRALLRAPFTAEFQATLPDAGTLASLLGPISPASGGSLYLDGEVHGADNRAEGYCNVSGLATRIRRLPLDWMRACLLFEGATTRVAYAEAQAGGDHLLISGTIANNAPHAYAAKGDLSVADIARRLAELGLTVPSSLGAGAITAAWSGEGDAEAHRGDFQTKVTEWVGPWTKTGLSGSAEGRYAPGILSLGKARITTKDLAMTLRVDATAESVSFSDLSVTRGESDRPLATASLDLPVNLFKLWSGGSLASSLGLDRALKAEVFLEGIKAEHLASLLGQERFCGGKVAGSFSLSGTPALPLLNGSMNVTGFSKEGMSSGDLSVSATHVAGVTTLRLDQGSKGTEMHLQASMPIRLARRDDRLLVDPSATVSATATFRQVLLDGWEEMVWGNGFAHATGLTGSGALTLEGTVGASLAKGALSLRASEVSLPGSYRLTNLVVPISFSGTAASMTGGAAALGGTPVLLTGEADWSAEPKARIRLSGKGVPLEIIPGMRGTAQGEVTAAFAKDQPALISGRVALTPSFDDLRPAMTPTFLPPGYEWNPAAASPPCRNQESEPRLDLALVTSPRATNGLPSAGEGRLHSPTGAGITADLRMTGQASCPEISGTVDLVEQTISFPSGHAVVPTARVTCSPGAGGMTGTAYAMTRRGMVAVEIGGSPARPSAIPEASWGDMADAMLALIDPSVAQRKESRAAGGTSHLAQFLFWLRQEMLFPVPAQAWASPQGMAAPSTLGFYGTPWGWTLQPFRTSPSTR